MPDRRIPNAAARYGRGILGHAASRSRRAHVVVDPVDEFAIADVVTYIVGGENGDAVALVDRNR